MNTKFLCSVCSFFILLVLLSCKKQVDSIKGIYQGAARHVRSTNPFPDTPELDTLFSNVRVIVSESTDSKRNKAKIDLAAGGQNFSWESVLVTDGNFDRDIIHYQGRSLPAKLTSLEGGFKNDSLNFLIEVSEYSSYVERWEYKTVKQ